MYIRYTFNKEIKMEENTVTKKEAINIVAEELQNMINLMQQYYWQIKPESIVDIGKFINMDIKMVGERFLIKKLD
jgi:uncharacterized protein (DUF4213/DUF364 family)